MPIIENKLTGQLCRLVELEHFCGQTRVWMEELSTGMRSVALEKFIQPYTEGKVVDFHA